MPGTVADHLSPWNRLVRVVEQHNLRVSGSTGCFSKRYYHHLLLRALVSIDCPTSPGLDRFALHHAGCCPGRRQALLFALKDHHNPKQPSNWTPDAFSFLADIKFRFPFSEISVTGHTGRTRGGYFDPRHARAPPSTQPRNRTGAFSSMDLFEPVNRPSWELTQPR